MTDRHAYQQKKARAARRSLQLVAEGQDIAPLPPVGNPLRRQAAEGSFRFFCEAYFKPTFCKPWSRDHLTVIGKIERAVRGGGVIPIAMPRGRGKSALCKAAVIWAVLTGAHRFIPYITATDEDAKKRIKEIKKLLTTSADLAEDFPEAIYPILQLQGETRRACGQTCYGVRTEIKWETSSITFPTIAGSRSSGAQIYCASITGHIRGASDVLPDGSTVRPSLAILDDPQTKSSAKSFVQTEDRMQIFNADIMGLAGPGETLTILIPCTVINPGDMADQLLDEYGGERTKTLDAMPLNMKLWNEYGEILRADRRSTGETCPRRATEFYRQHRRAMDEGAVSTWPEDYSQTKGEISAVQHAMNIFFRDEAAFWSEYQNEPIKAAPELAVAATATELSERLSRIPRGHIPAAATVLASGVDIHNEILYYTVAAFADGYTGWVIDYGTWPEQRRPFWSHEKPPNPISKAYPGMGVEAAIRAALYDLTSRLASTAYPRQDGSAQQLDRIILDSGYKPDQVRDVVLNSPHARILSAGKGLGIGARKTPMAEYHRKPGERHGWHWMQTAPARGFRTINIDVNFWKTFLQARWRTAIGDPGALALYGDVSAQHEFYATHLASERPTAVTANGRTVEEWSLSPNQPNHWLDTLVHCATAANMCGISLSETASAPLRPQRQRIKLSDLQKKRR